MSASPGRGRQPRSWFSPTAITDALNYDFCPWANRYVYWLKQPIGWFLVGSAASLLTAVFVAPHAWIIFGALVVVMIMGVAWPWFAVRGVRAEIQFECRRATEGEHVAVRLQVSNPWPWPLWGLTVEKGFFVVADGDRPVVALARVPGWCKSEFVFEFRPDRRGVYPRSAPELATGFPFGIWRAHRVIDISRPLLVWPQTVSLHSVPSLGGELADVIGMLFDRPGNEGDTIGVRPFRQGDRLRSIHWAQTARRDSFIVAERQTNTRRPVAIHLDLRSFNNSHDSEDDPLETAIRVAASVAQGFHSHHAQVRFTLGAIDLTLEPGSVGVRRLLDALARFEASDEHHSAGPRHTRDALSVVVTTPDGKQRWSTAGVGGDCRFVVIESEQSPAPPTDVAASSEGDRTWIRITAGDHSRQLRRQWERVCHDTVSS